MMMNLLFDMDGCLIDSEEVQRSAFFGSYAAVVGDGRCPSFEEYIRYTGDSIDNVLRKMGLPAAMAPVFREISERSVDRIRVYWPVMEVIRELRQRGCRAAICTGKDHYRADAILRHYDMARYFDALVGAEDVAEHKPSPEPALKALELLGADKKTAVLIGDGYNDILCAKNAGIPSVLTLWFGDSGVPREADYTVSDADQLLQTILQLMG